MQRSILFHYTTLFRSKITTQPSVAMAYARRAGVTFCNAISSPLMPFHITPTTGHLNNTEINAITRSEEHTSELQSRGHLVCRHLLNKKKSVHDKTTTR